MNNSQKPKKEKVPPQGCEGMISMLAFATIVGVTKQGVSKAIGAGKLTEGNSFKKSGKSYWFDEEKAKTEWASSIKVSQVKNSKLLDGLGIEKASTVQVDEVKDMTLQQVKEETMRTELRLLMIEENKQLGVLIERQVVEQNLEAFGIEIRTQFTNVPGRVIASLRNAKTDAEAENILANEINEALNGCADVITKDIGA